MLSQAELTLGALALIQSVPPEHLATIASARAITPQESWTPVDLARALCSSEAIWHQVRQLDRDALLGLDDLLHDRLPAHTPLTTQLANQGLAEHAPPDPGSRRPTLRPEVAQAIADHEPAWREAVLGIDKGKVGRHEGVAPTSSIAPRPAPSHTLTVIALIIWAVEELILPRTTKTSTPAGLARALPALPDELTPLLHTALTEAISSGLIARVDGAWQTGPQADLFLEGELASQWQFLLEGWRAHRGGLFWRAVGGASVTDFDQLAGITRAAYPLTDLGDLATWVERGQTLGVFSGHSPTDIWVALRSPSDLASLLQSLCPPPAAGVYPDSMDSFVAPGFLTRGQRLSLSQVARCVAPGVTSLWQVDPERILVALSTQAPEAVLARLDQVVLGGVPSTLRELVVDTHTKASRLQVTPSDRGTTITLTDPTVGPLLLVDSKCRPLRLIQVAEQVLHSPVAVDPARVILAEAGYPTFAPVFEGTPLRAATPVRPISETTSALPDSWWVTMTLQARETTGSTLWTEEILREAIRDRVTLSICVEDGSGSRWFTLEPKAIATGRLRALDRVAEVERTLPLTTIRAIEPAIKASGHSA